MSTDAEVKNVIEENSGAGNGAEKQATGKQLVVIVFILALATKMFLLPIFLIRVTGRDAYIALCIDGGLDLVALFITLAAVHICKDVDFFTLMTRTLGTVGSKIVVGLFALFLFFKLNISVAETLTFYVDSVFAGFDVAMMIFVLLAFLAAVGNHTLRAVARLNELIVPVIVVCVVILGAIVIMTGFDLANIFPAMQNPAKFKSAIFEHSAWIGDFSPIVLFVGRTKVKKHTGIIAAASGVIGTGVAVFFAVAMCAAFGNVPHLVDSSTNLSSILQFSIGNVYGRIDLFSSVLWSISAFIECALFFYATCRCVSFVLGNRARFWIALGVSGVLYVTQVFAMTDPTIFSLVVTSAPIAIITPVCTFAMPIVTLVCGIVYTRRNAADRKSRGSGLCNT